MTPQHRLRWYAVRCDTSRAVIKAGVGIARLGVHVFIPKHYRQERQGKWLVAVEQGLLFPPYLFIAMRAGSTQWGEVAAVDGVDRIMGGRNRMGDPVPCPIPYKVMRKLRTMHKAGERKRATERFKPGEKVRVMNGAFAGFDGIFDKPVKDRVRLLISIFGRESSVDVQEVDIRAA